MDSERLPAVPFADGGPDRAAHLRDAADLMADLVRRDRAKVVALRGDRVRIEHTGEAARLVLRTMHPSDMSRLTLFLGFGEAAGEPAGGERTAYLGVVEDPTDGDGDDGWQTLRAVGGRLGELDAGLASTLLGLANWHRNHRFCERCGGPTEPAKGGWIQVCAADGSEHFPRTDASVIMSVVDDAGRLLLGRGASWPENQYSVLAGFVEPGESLESAVVREVREEAGIEVTDVRYVGSQPWPFPSSLMLGFTARAVTTDLVPDCAEMAEVRWVTRTEYAALLRSRAIRVPGGISIARRLIERWLGQSVQDAAGGPVMEGWRRS